MKTQQQTRCHNAHTRTRRRKLAHPANITCPKCNGYMKDEGNQVFTCQSCGYLVSL